MENKKRTNPYMNESGKIVYPSSEEKIRKRKKKLRGGTEER